MTSACFNFDDDLATCQREGRCTTNNAGGGIGLSGGGTGITGGGTGITGGGWINPSDGCTLVELNPALNYADYYSDPDYTETFVVVGSDAGTSIRIGLVWYANSQETGLDAGANQPIADNPRFNIYESHTYVRAEYGFVDVAAVSRGSPGVAQFTVRDLRLSASPDASCLYVDQFSVDAGF